MYKNARLARLEEWLTLLYDRPFAGVCLNCPPSPASVMGRAAVVAVALALSGVGLDPQSVERRVQESDVSCRYFRIEEGVHGFGCCLIGKEFLAVVESLLD